MRRSVALSALLALVAVSTPACHSKLEARQPQQADAALRVMTYNVNYGLAGDGDTIDVIRSGDADVVFLQETNEAWEMALRSELSERYPFMAFRHCCLAGGLGVLSKHDFSDEEYIESQKGWFPAWRVVVYAPFGDMQVLNVHLRPPVSDSGSVLSGYVSTRKVREAEVKQYFEHLDPDLPTMVVGDFNEKNARAMTYLVERGFKSGLPQFATPQETWKWNTSVGTVSAQLDHLVYDDRLTPLNVRVMAGGRSDHRPVIGDFERTTPKPSQD